MAILVMIFSCPFFWGSFCERTAPPMPMVVCQEQVKYLNEHRLYTTDFAYCKEATDGR